MPEGPSIVIAKEELEQFIGKKILDAKGSAPIEMKKLAGKEIKKIATWGKHLLFVFDGFTIRIHFLMFGKYFINSSKKLQARLSLKFAKGEELNIYTSSVKMIEEPLDELYDWSADIMAKRWNTRGVRKKLKEIPELIISDALMDQEIFPGLGNIIKNEVLYRARVHPKSLTGDIPASKISEIIKVVRKYAFEFLDQRRKGTLGKNWQVYTRKKCIRDGSTIKKEYLAKRRTFYCNTCQVKY
ncbi:MAG: endonuclease [Chitinophagaceae bacterium]|nr:endonuclease [Chitinophagaceae bacterium]